jgi:hypothetical protein
MIEGWKVSNLTVLIKLVAEDDDKVILVGKQWDNW